MNPRLTLFAAAVVLGAAPLPAYAQAWPVTVVASAPRILPLPARPLMVRDADAGVRRQGGVPPADPGSPRVSLKLSNSDEVPDVDLRPKSEWTDDEGWRASPTRVAFKRRF